MKGHEEKLTNMVQPKKILLSSFHLTNGTVITPPLLFYLKIGLVCKKYYWSVRCNPKEYSNTFLQCAVNALRQGEETPNSSVVPETMKLLDNNSYGHQLLDRSRHTVKKYLSDEKTHCAKKAKCSCVLITLLINCTKLKW